MNSVARSMTAAFLVLAAAAVTGPAGAQPYPEVLWWFDLNAPSFGSAAVDDLDGDGLPEIVFGTYFNDETIHCLNGDDGSELWSHFTDGCNDASPVIADVDLDGELEVVVPASSPCSVYCFDGATGDVEWKAFTGYGNCIDSPPAVADLDNDGLPEVVHGTFNGWVFCWNGEDGSQAWACSTSTAAAIQSCPDVLDLDGDGDLDVVVAQWSGNDEIYGIDGESGEIMWTCSLPQDYMYHGGSFADVDEDGKPEIVIGCYDHFIYVLNAEDGSLVWSYMTPNYVAAPTSLADLDGDGHLEIVYCSYNQLGVLDHDGGLVWSAGLSGSSFRGAALCNIDGDTITDIIVGADGGWLRAYTGTSPDLIWEIDLQALYGNTYDIDHAPTLADFDGDGEIDVFIVGGYGTSSAPQNNHGRAYALTAGPGGGQVWTMFRHDARRSAFQDGGGTGTGGEAPPVGTIELHAQPNPFTSSVGIGYVLPSSGMPEICLYDLTGRIVGSVTAGPGASGQAVLDGSGLPPGAYICRLTSGSGSASVKLLKLD
jgi:outer membrane protein assembly factor BamB